MMNRVGVDQQDWPDHTTEAERAMTNECIESPAEDGGRVWI
jgi:hypothetical protein